MLRGLSRAETPMARTRLKTVVRTADFIVVYDSGRRGFLDADCIVIQIKRGNWSFIGGSTFELGP